MSELRLRIYTATVLIILFGASLCYTPAYLALIAAFFGVGFWEWAYHLQPGRFAWMRLGLCVLGAAAFYTYPCWELPVMIWAVLSISLIARWHWWNWDSWIYGLLLIPAAGIAAAWFYLAQGPWAVIFVLAMVAAADTGAYFTGKAWGKKKILPEVSPKKTWVGFFGGWVSVLLVALSAHFLFGLAYLACIVIGSCVFLAAFFGDLFESLLKRRAGVKDSGTILPGHGGVLDRLDGFIAALPVAHYLWGLYV